MNYDPSTRSFPPPPVPVREEWLDMRTEAVLEPKQRIIDAHHHLWNRPKERYLAHELLSDLRSGHDVRATVFVQCRTMYRLDGPLELKPLGETAYINSLANEFAAAECKIAAAIVCMADLLLGDSIRPVLEAHGEIAGARLRGVRCPVAYHEEVEPLTGTVAPHLLSNPQFRRGFAHLAPLNLSFDAWVYHSQLDEVAALAKAFPETRIVLNHGGGPLGVGSFQSRSDEVFREWKLGMSNLAAQPNVFVKIGGFGVHALGNAFHKNPMPPSSEVLATTFRPYVDTCIELFGPGRCMFESNFPIDKINFGYRELWNSYKRIVAGASADEKDALFFDTATRVYLINAGLLERPRDRGVMMAAMR